MVVFMLTAQVNLCCLLDALACCLLDALAHELNKTENKRVMQTAYVVSMSTLAPHFFVSTDRAQHSCFHIVNAFREQHKIR